MSHKTLLGVWAHPDDETWLCAGLMARAAAAGDRVVCITATRGELGSPDEERWPSGAPLAAVRTAEMASALAVLGVTEHHWLDYPDGGCAEVDQDEAVRRVTEVMTEVQPDTVLTFGPDGGTYHPDHMAVSRWVSAAAAESQARVLHQAQTPEWQERMSAVVPLEFVMMADRPPVAYTPEECAFLLEATGDALDEKYRALLCQESQVGPLLSLAGPDLYRQMLALEAFTNERPPLVD